MPGTLPKTPLSSHRIGAAAGGSGLQSPPRTSAIGLPLIVLLVVYAPALVVSYGFSDDYTFLHWSLCAPQKLREVLDGAGRPINGFLLEHFFRFAGGVPRLGLLRLFGLLSLFVTYLCLFQELRRHFEDLRMARDAALLFCFLPSAQLIAGWTQLFTMPLAILCAYAGYFIVESMPRRLPQLLLGQLFAMLVVATASLLYQPYALYYLVFFSIRYWPFDSFRGEVLRRYVAHAAALGGGLALAFVYFKLQPHRAERGAMVEDIMGKLVWFVDQPLTNAFRLFSLRAPEGNWRLPVSLFVVAISGMLVATKGGKRFVVLAFAMTGVLLLGAYLPNLIVKENWASYRSLFSLSSLALVLVILGGHALLVRFGIASRLRAGLFSFAAAAGALAASYSLLALFVLPQHDEWQLLVSLLPPAESASTVPIYFRQPTWRETTAPASAYDEFGVPSSMADWGPFPMLSLALSAHRGVPVCAEQHFQKGPMTEKVPDQVFLIDMTRLGSLGKQPGLLR